MTRYLVEKVEGSLAFVSSHAYGMQLWDHAKVRKTAVCSNCGRTLAKGEEGFRPITNKGNRSARLCALCVVPPKEAHNAPQTE